MLKYEEGHFILQQIFMPLHSHELKQGPWPLIIWFL